MERLAFLNNYPILQSAVCDSSAPLPGYIYEEIKSISFASESHCRQLLEYLLFRLDSSDSCNIKFRVLKVIEYLLKNGNGELSHDLHKNSTAIQAALGYNGPPNDVYGNKKYEMVRKAADNVIKLLFDDSVPDSHSPRKSPDQFTAVSGMGSFASSGSMEGFGNTPLPNSSSGTALSLDMSDMVDRMFNITTLTSPTKAGGLTMDEVDGKFETFKPPFIETIQTDKIIQVPQETVVKKKTRKGRRQPGRAGGGWEDDDDIGSIESGSTYSASASVSLNDMNSQVNLESSVENAGLESMSSEIAFFNEFVSGDPAAFFTVSELQTASKRCSSLNCEKVLQLVGNELKHGDESKQMKAMMLLELLLHTDFINPEVIHQLLHAEYLKVKESLPSGPLKFKAHKLCLTMDKLHEMMK